MGDRTVKYTSYLIAMAVFSMALGIGHAATSIYSEDFSIAPVVNDQVDNGNSNYGATGEPDDMNQDEWYTRGTQSTITHTNGAVEIYDLGTHVWYLMDLTDLANPPESNSLFTIQFDVESIDADIDFWAFAGGGLDYNGTTDGTNGYLFFRMHSDPPLFNANGGATKTLIVDTTISTTVTNAGTFTSGTFILTDLDNPGDYVAICFGGADNKSITIDNLQVISEAITGTVVTVEVPDAAAAEEGSDPGTIRITRDDISGDLDVYFTLDGSADTNDYTETHTSPVTITNGSSFVDLVFTPVDDSVAEGDSGETIQLTVDADAAYVVGSPSDGAITIAENDLTIIPTVADGNWTNTATWTGGIVPGAANTADINHNVTIDSDVGTVNEIDPANNNTDFITMSNGTLVVTGTAAKNFSGGCTMGLYSGSGFTSAQWYRLGGDVTIIVDNSSFTTDDLQDQGGSDSITVRNGSTFTVSSRYPLGNGTTTFTIEGAGNTVYASLDEFGVNGTNNFEFVLDGSDEALSTFTFDTFELTDDGERNLTIDATEWNGVSGTYTLFSGTTLTDGGTFDSVTFVGVSSNTASIAYDYDSDEITLDLTVKGMSLIVK